MSFLEQLVQGRQFLDMSSENWLKWAKFGCLEMVLHNLLNNIYLGMEREDNDLPEFAVPDPSHMTHFFNHLLDESNNERPIFHRKAQMPPKDDFHLAPSEHSDEENP